MRVLLLGLTAWIAAELVLLAVLVLIAEREQTRGSDRRDRRRRSAPGERWEHGEGASKAA